MQDEPSGLPPVPPPAAPPVSAVPPGSASGVRVDASWERGVLEKLAFSALREQRASRRWGIFFKFATLAYLTLFVVLLFNIGRGSTPPEVAGPHAAMVSIDGAILPEGRNSAEKVISALNDAFDTQSAKGVILRINSPGGSPVQSGMIADEIRRLRAKNPDKPVHVVVEDICASGGYYIAAAATNIYVDKASLVGSIGVILNGFGAVDLMKKAGVERRAITAGENKAFLDPFQPLEDDHRKHAQGLLDEVHKQFIDTVKQGRGRRLKDAPDIFSGLIWTGARAVELGLADGMGTVESVARDVIKADEVVEYTVKENPFERISKQFAADASASAASALMRALAEQGAQLR